MNLLSKLDELEQDLREAQALEELAMQRWSMCKINTPGRCHQQEKAYHAASAEVARIVAEIRKVERRGR